jgi:protease-4
MTQRNLIEQLAKPWLIDGMYAQQYMPMVKSFLETGFLPKQKGVDYSELRAALKMYAIEPKSAIESKYDLAVPNSIAVIPVQGVLMKEDGLCSKGTASMVRELKEANANPMIKSIVLKIDSGGGSVDGTETFAREVQNSKKPIITFVDGTMASAAYWVGSGAKEIIISGKTSGVGSIGTMFGYQDARPMLEEAGVKFHDVRATKSVDKNEYFYQMLEGNYEPMKAELLDPLNEVFLNSVRSVRGSKIKNEENVFTGKMFFGQNSVNEGLVDSIGSFEYAIQRADELGKENKISQKINSTDMGIKEKLASMKDGITALINSMDEGAETKVSSEDVLAKVEDFQTELSEMSSEFESSEALQAKLDELQTTSDEKINSLESTISEMETNKEAMETKIDELKAANLVLSGKAKDPKPKVEGKELNDATADDKPLTKAEIIEKNRKILANLENNK